MTEPARSIGRLGFRRWYERRLIEGLTFKRPEAIPTLIFVFVAGLVCWYALQRYRAIVDEAERLGEHAVCGSCSAYGAFKLLGDYPKMNVRCRKCGNEWQLDN